MFLPLRKLRLLFKLLTKIIHIKQFIKIVLGKYPIELKAYLDLCTVRENSMGKIKTWKIDV